MSDDYTDETAAYAKKLQCDKPHKVCIHHGGHNRMKTVSIYFSSKEQALDYVNMFDIKGACITEAPTSKHLYLVKVDAEEQVNITDDDY